MFCGCIGFLANCVCAIFVPVLSVFSIKYFTVIKQKNNNNKKQTNKNPQEINRER
jgi:hypothetical protein